jgi:hypothetical protein
MHHDDKATRYQFAIATPRAVCITTGPGRAGSIGRDMERRCKVTGNGKGTFILHRSAKNHCDKNHTKRRVFTQPGHVWTAPWQELSDVAAALVECGHVSGRLMRRGWPLALMLCADQVPIVNTHSKMR